MRLDIFLGLHLPSRQAGKRLIELGQVEVDGRVAEKAGQHLPAGVRIAVVLPPPQPGAAAAEDIPLDILFEDEDLIVLNKAKGMVVHPAPGNTGGTLVNALMHHCRGSLSGVGGVERPGIVHRLDKWTSGAMAVAKNDRAHLSLARQIKDRTMRRVYLALVHGRPPEQGVVDAPVGRHPTQRHKMAVVAGGRSAVTHFTVLERLGALSLLELRLETGRTHQIRVHMSHIGFPVAGDDVYGPRQARLGLAGPGVSALLTSQALHAWRLSFTHPRLLWPVTFAAVPPAEFTAAVAALRSTPKA